MSRPSPDDLSHPFRAPAKALENRPDGCRAPEDATVEHCHSQGCTNRGWWFLPRAARSTCTQRPADRETGCGFFRNCDGCEHLRQQPNGSGRHV